MKSLHKIYRVQTGKQSELEGFNNAISLCVRFQPVKVLRDLRWKAASIPSSTSSSSSLKDRQLQTTVHQLRPKKLRPCSQSFSIPTSLKDTIMRWPLMLMLASILKAKYKHLKGRSATCVGDIVFFDHALRDPVLVKKWKVSRNRRKQKLFRNRRKWKVRRNRRKWRVSETGRQETEDAPRLSRLA